MNPDFDEFLAFITNMVIRVVKFSSGGYKLLRIGVMGEVSKKVPKSDF